MVYALLFSLLIFPGVLFLVIFSLFSQWVKRKIVAHIQKRVGPKYVGPFGILQPFADVYKLMLSKETSIPTNMPVRLMLFFPLLGIAGLAAALLFTPLSLHGLSAKYDFILFIYLTLYATLAIILLSIGSASIYPSVGSARYIAIILIAEPVIAISILSMVKVLSPENLSIYEALSVPYGDFNAQGIRISLKDAIALSFAAISFSLGFMSKAMLKPFDISEAKTEIAGGVIAELSGQLLGLYILLHEIESTVYLIVFSGLLFPYLTVSSKLMYLLTILIKYFAILGFFTVVSYSMGRLRIDQALRLLFKYALPLCILSVTLSFIL